MMVIWFSAKIISLKARDLDYSLDDLFFWISEKASCLEKDKQK